MTDARYIEKARDEYQHEGDCEIDDNAVISRGSEPGAYVQAWVWVNSDTFEEDSDTEAGQQGSEDDEDQGPGRCVTHKNVYCDQDGICPLCKRDEAITALLNAIGNIGTLDIYTDSVEYGNRTAAAHALAHLCNRIIGGENVTVADVEDITTAAHETAEVD